MNYKIGMAGSIINVLSVAGFALCMLAGTNFGSYVVCMFIAFSFVMMMSGFAAICTADRKTAGYASMIFAGVYAVFILAVYFAQVTSVRLDNISAGASKILNYQEFGLFFNYDLLGYGIMALSTFFAGLTIDGKSKTALWLKRLLLIHGIFFISCFILPMIGLFNTDMPGASLIGTAVLEVWCVYFIPVGLLSFIYFKDKYNESAE